MTWFKVDDSFHSHPKVLAASPAALGLWVVAGSWSGANLSDGFIPDHVLPRLLADAATLAQELVTARLWRRVRGGYRFHDWAHFNPPAKAVLADREAARERMRAVRARRKEGPTRDHRADFEQTSKKGRESDDQSPSRKTTAAHQANRSPEHEANVRDMFATPTRPDPYIGGALGDPLTPGPREAPPPKCPEHLNTEDPPPCGACADARKLLQRWKADKAIAESLAQSAQARERAEAVRADINACNLCDSDGRLAGNRLCTHDPDQPQRLDRGIAAARAAAPPRRPQ